MTRDKSSSEASEAEGEANFGEVIGGGIELVRRIDARRVSNSSSRGTSSEENRAICGQVVDRRRLIAVNCEARTASGC